jgi:hypothetical protein
MVYFRNTLFHSQHYQYLLYTSDCHKQIQARTNLQVNSAICCVKPTANHHGTSSQPVTRHRRREFAVVSLNHCR